MHLGMRREATRGYVENLLQIQKALLGAAALFFQLLPSG